MNRVSLYSRQLRVITSLAGCLFMIAGAIYCGPGFADEKDNPHSSVATAPSNLKPVLLSEEVAAGFLIQKVDPEYPRLARAARVSGIVTLHAIISKAGDITNLNAICGPQILQEASLKAVQKWKYRPYIMHGEPFEVETTIRVTFTLGDKKKLKFSKDTCPD